MKYDFITFNATKPEFTDEEWGWTLLEVQPPMEHSFYISQEELWINTINNKQYIVERRFDA